MRGCGGVRGAGGGAVGCVARAGGAGGWSGHVMGRVARGVAWGMCRWGEVRGHGDDSTKGFPCRT